MARLGKQIPSPYHRPIARRLHTIASRTASSDIPDKREKIVRRRLVKANNEIAEKILVVLCVALFVLCVILLR
jgi:hypothetical protein